MVIGGATLMLTVIGLVMVLSSSSVEGIGSADGSYGLFWRQLFWAAGGLVGLLGAAFLPVRAIRALAWPAVGIAVVLLALVAFTPLGVEVGGNRNWLRVGPLQAQPAEAAKLALALWGGAVLERKGRLLGQVKHDVVPVIFPVGLIVLGLIMAGNDLGTALIVVCVLAAMLYVAGTNRILFVAAAGLAIIATLGLTLFASHRMVRVQAWLGNCDHPTDPCFQPENGLYALTSGGWWGVGLGQSRQKWSYVPEAQNDFIFTILGEELGLLGTLLVVLLFTALAAGMYRVAVGSDSVFVRITTFGILAWFVGQAFLNIAMVSGVLPVVGVPLPFISYGGSALTLSLIAVGIVLAFARDERKVARRDALAKLQQVTGAPDHTAHGPAR